MWHSCRSSRRKAHSRVRKDAAAPGSAEQVRKGACMQRRCCCCRAHLVQHCAQDVVPVVEAVVITCRPQPYLHLSTPVDVEAQQPRVARAELRQLLGHAQRNSSSKRQGVCRHLRRLTLPGHCRRYSKAQGRMWVTVGAAQLLSCRKWRCGVLCCPAGAGPSPTFLTVHCLARIMG